MLEVEKSSGMLKLKKFLSALVIIALVSCTALAGGSLGDWSNVRKLKPGSMIVVGTRTGQFLRAEVMTVTDEKLFLEVRLANGDLQDVTLNKSDVTEVRRSVSGRGGINPLLGAAIGLGVGVALGAGYDSTHKGGDDPGIGKFLFGLLGTVGGLAVGRAIPAREKTIYVAP